MFTQSFLARLSMRAFVSMITGVSVLVGCNKELDYGRKKLRPDQKSDPVTTTQDTGDQQPVTTTQPTQPSSTGAVAARLSGLPSLRTSVDKLDVTVGGDDVKEYQYAIHAMSDNCDNVQYSAWVGVDKRIEDVLTLEGQHTLCVKGRTDESNPQENPTTHTWIQEAPASIRAQLSNTPPDGHTASRLNVIVGGIGIVDYSWTLVPGAEACPAQTPQDWQVVATHITADVSQPGDRKLCVKGRTANGTLQDDYTEHRWTQEAEQQPQQADPTPQNVRIDLQGLNHESWNKVCLYISANKGPYEKLACNKQDSTPPKQFLEFSAGISQCVSLDFRLEVFAYTESCRGKDPELCSTALNPDPIRHAVMEKDKGFFRFLAADQISRDSLQKNSIQDQQISDEELSKLKTESEEWLSESHGRQWYRLFIEDQSDDNMKAFLETGDANTTGIDFDDFVIDIRAIDVNFEVPGQGVNCP